MFPLNLPSFDTNIVTNDGLTQIFDILRRRFVALTPEEWVRQHFIHYLLEHKGYPFALLANEVTINLNGMMRRCDSVLFSKSITPRMIIEYKAPEIKISSKTFEQINAYNHVLKVPYIIASNGLTHYCCHLEAGNDKYTFLQDIPLYSQLI